MTRDLRTLLFHWSSSVPALCQGRGHCDVCSIPGVVIPAPLSGNTCFVVTEALEPGLMPEPLLSVGWSVPNA